jgi:hypothetical protein
MCASGAAHGKPRPTFASGDAELRTAGGDAQVAHLRKQPPARERQPVDRGDDRLGDAHVVAEHWQPPDRQHAEVQFRHLLEIGTGGERLLAGAGQDRDADRALFLDALESREQPFAHGRVDRVALRGAVEGDDDDAVALVFEQDCVAHGVAFRRGSWVRR